jgi:quinol monooxygenase YgiN
MGATRQKWTVTMHPDQFVTISPHFEVPPNRTEALRRLCERFVQAVAEDAGCVRYSWGFDGSRARCREDFIDADAALAHFARVAALTDEMSQLAQLVSLEVLAPRTELDKLRPVLTERGHHLFEVQIGFHR